MLKKEVTLKKRDLYLNKLIAFQDMDLVKVITGIRRFEKYGIMMKKWFWLENVIILSHKTALRLSN